MYALKVPPILSVLLACVILPWLPSQAALPPKPAPIANDPAPKGVKVTTYDELIKSGWKMERPPYPYTAHQAHEQGTVYVELTTDSTGKVIHARTSKATKLPILAPWTGTWVTARWHGPPNVKVVAAVEYQLN